MGHDYICMHACICLSAVLLNDEMVAEICMLEKPLAILPTTYYYIPKMDILLNPLVYHILKCIEVLMV